MWEWDIFTNTRILWLQEKYKGKLQLKLFPSCSVSTVSVFPPWTTEFLEGEQRILNSFIFWFLLWALWKDWKSEEMYHKTISVSSHFFILAFHFSDCKWIDWLFHPGQEWKRRLIPGLRGWLNNVISRWAEAEKCNCGDSINISGMMDDLWLTAPQHGTCNQKYDLFHNKISKFVFWRNCYWKPRQGNIYRNSFGEIYIRDKPKYLTLNSNNLNNYRYSEINNFFAMDYADCFDTSPILDPSWKCCAISFFQPDVVKNIISSDMMISVYYADGAYLVNSYWCMQRNMPHSMYQSQCWWYVNNYFHLFYKIWEKCNL